MATPPPSLRRKLGFGEAAKVLVYGAIGSDVLADALHGAVVSTPSQADMALAVVGDAASLAAGIAAHAHLPPGRPLWIVHGKGRATAFGEAAVRQIMRESGFIDTKLAAVSDALTATRYSRR
jgi:hypothetical protein